MQHSKISQRVPLAKMNDFNHFVKSSGAVYRSCGEGSNFLIDFLPVSSGEYSTFLQRAKKDFEAKIVKEIRLCIALCRDGTNCLNHAKYESYCSRHRKVSEVVGEKGVIPIN